MIPDAPPPPEDADAEIFRLIQSLHEDEKRLEDLTGGEVDTVSDRDGRTVLLRRAQEHMRLREGARQAAILNGLPAHIAMLDARGLIVSVNDGWRDFAGANALQGPGCAVGTNYLEICDNARGEGSIEAHRAAAGIRSVRDGTANGFTMEYSCHSPTELRWFLMTVSPLGEPAGVVVMHLNMTTQKQTEEDLRASEQRFRQVAENISEVFFLRDLDGSRVHYVSPAYEKIWGRTCESLYANPKSWGDAIHPDDRAAASIALRAGLNTGFDKEFRIIRPDGEIRWIHSRGSPILDGAGKSYRTAGIASDVTQRKESDRRIAYLNRVYALLSGINTLIVRVSGRDELFQAACRLAVEKGGFRMAMIGLVDRSAMTFASVAMAGEDAELQASIKGILSSVDSASTTMVARAVRAKKAIVSNDSEHDPQLLLGRRFAESGVHSIAVLPLIVADETVGMLALYAAESEFFHDEEIAQLTELAGDIAFAIDHLEKGERLHHLAYFDALTGLANRSLFIERVAHHMRAAVADRHQLALYMVDVQRFKNINDSLGRTVGDALLRQVAEWLASVARDPALVARLGADIFAVVLPHVKPEGNVVHLLEKTMEAFMEHPFHLDGAVLRASVRVGAAIFPDDSADATTLIDHAEAALKKAKASRERYLFYTPTVTGSGAARLTLETQLRQALENEEFVLHYQPKINLQTGKVTSAEALIRWNDPRTGLVPPGQFIPVLEETGLIFEVGRWALRKAIGEHLRWRRGGLAALRIAVNVSPLQLRHRSFIAEIEEAIGVDPYAAAGLELEMTESLLMENVRRSITSLQEIRALGIKIAIDDFGTGFSSLSYLAKLPVDTLKIDRSFVVDMTAGPEGLALVSTVITLAHALKLTVVAEGVETDEQSRLLRLLGCDELQGFLFSKPVPIEIFEARFLTSPQPTDEQQ